MHNADLVSPGCEQAVATRECSWREVEVLVEGVEDESYDGVGGQHVGFNERAVGFPDLGGGPGFGDAEDVVFGDLRGRSVAF